MDFDDFEWSQAAPTPASMSEAMCDMFLFRKKKHFFYEKKILCTLHYSTAMPKVRSITKITDFTKIIDFHCFLSKNIDFDDF